MRRSFYAFISILVIVILSGCIQDKIVIHVKPDGSGRIEETSLLSNSMLDMMESLSGSLKDTKSEKGEADMAPKEAESPREKKETRDDIIEKMVADAGKRADNFGPGVRFISAKPAKTNTASGYIAVYSFDNINDVKVNQNPSEREDTERGQAQKSLKEENLLFKFTKGAPAKLVIMLPEEDKRVGDKEAAQKSGKGDEGKAAPEGTNKDSSIQAAEMMKNIFQDMKLSVSVVIEGTIVATNATYRDGSTLQLIDIDFGKIINNGTIFKDMLAVNPQSIGATKASFKNVEGLRFESVNPVTVEFK